MSSKFLNLSTDNTLGGNSPSDTKAVAEKAIKEYVDNKQVTEATVSGWGFTKNTGTVTSVNNVQPVNGNVTLSIPTVNDATLTIQSNGTTVGTFTANSSSNVTANISSTQVIWRTYS